jgi:bifunctional non-homologous end joining protein LigD
VPVSGSGWIHQIKHDGFRVMARRDGAGGPLFTRHGNDFARRFSPAVAAITARRSFLIDGEAIITNGDGLAVFELIRHKRHGGGCGADLIRSDRARRSRFAPRAD